MNHKGLRTYVEIEISSEEENRDVAKEESLGVLEAARNANPSVSLTSCVSTTSNPLLPQTKKAVFIRVRAASYSY